MIAAGGRYTIRDTCPWPERRGLTARRMVPTTADAARYPFHGLGREEVVILIENDPLPGHPDGWSCVIHRNDLAP